MPPNPLTASSSSTATSDPSWPKPLQVSRARTRTRARRTSGLTQAGLFGDTSDGKAIVAGKPESSVLVAHHKQGCRRAHAAGRQRQETDRRGNCADRACQREKAPNGKAIGPTSPGSPSGSPDRCIGRAPLRNEIDRFVRAKQLELGLQRRARPTASRSSAACHLI